MIFIGDQMKYLFIINFNIIEKTKSLLYAAYELQH